MIPVPPQRPWVHIGQVREELALAAFKLGANRGVELRVEASWPTAADGCWCYVGETRPHPHTPGLGKCPVQPATDNYVRLEVEVIHLSPELIERRERVLRLMRRPGVVRDVG